MKEELILPFIARLHTLCNTDSRVGINSGLFVARKDEHGVFEHILRVIVTDSLNCHLHLSCMHAIDDVRHLHTSSLLVIMSSIRFVNQCINFRLGVHWDDYAQFG